MDFESIKNILLAIEDTLASQKSTLEYYRQKSSDDEMTIAQLKAENEVLKEEVETLKAKIEVLEDDF